MMGTAYTLATAPLLPWWVIGAFALAALLIIALGAWRRARGLAWRCLALVALFVAIINPALVEEQREPQRDVAVVIVDESPSQRIGDRSKYAEEALRHVADRLGRFKDLDVRIVRAGKPDESSALADDGTRLFAPLEHALQDVPRQRLAGVVMITDGEVHDVPLPERLTFNAPLHVLLTGRPDEG